MSFQFNSEFDADTYKTLASLAKYNDGVFKSLKQKNYLMKTMYLRSADAPDMMSYYGIEGKPGTKAVVVEAMCNWSDYGSRGMIPISWIFFIDSIGVYKKAKLGYRGNLRDGAYPDPKKTKLEWERPEFVTAPHLVEEEKAVAVAEEKAKAEGKHVGAVGKRSTFEGTVVFVKEIYTDNRTHYYDTGVRILTHVETADGAKLVYWNRIADQGAKVKFSATVKDHSFYQGVPQTILSRATKVEVL